MKEQRAAKARQGQGNERRTPRVASRRDAEPNRTDRMDGQWPMKLKALHCEDVAVAVARARASTPH